MDSDADLYRQWLRTGAEDAFATLARRHATLVADVAYRIGGDRGLAEDALQDAFLALARDQTPHPAQVGVRAWLARAAILKALNSRSSRAASRRRERLVGKSRAEARMDTARGDSEQAARDVLDRLGGESAALLSLRYVHGLPYRELALVLDVTDAAARVRVHRALERARKGSPHLQADARAIGAFLATAKPFALPSEAVEAALSRALRSGRSAASEEQPPRQGTSGLRTVLLSASVLLLAGLAYVTWRALTPASSDRTPSSRAEATFPPPTLTGRPPGPSPTQAGVPGTDAPGTDAPGTGAQAPGTMPQENSPKGEPLPTHASQPERPKLPATTSVALRMELMGPDGDLREVDVDRVICRGKEWPGSYLRDNPGEFRVRPGWAVTLETKDARVATPVVTLRVPDPVPVTLLIRVPAVDDPGLGRLTLEVVDALTGEALPDAVLHWGEGEAPAALQGADAQGRILIAPPPAGSHLGDVKAALLRFDTAEKTVSAPGYLSAGWVLGGLEFWPAVEAGDLERWLKDGVKRIPLTRLPDLPGLEERVVRLLNADGQPLAGAYVYVAHPAREGSRTPLHTALRLDDGLRRSDSEGLVRFPMCEVIALTLSVGRIQVAAWGLAGVDWPAAGPRDIRVPAINSVELVLTDLPDKQSVRWSRDPLGVWRTSGTSLLLEGRIDPAALTFLREKQAYFRIPDLARGDLPAHAAVIRIPLTPSQTHIFHLQIGEERRRWMVRPMAGEARRIVRSWKSLPRDP